MNWSRFAFSVFASAAMTFAANGQVNTQMREIGALSSESSSAEIVRTCQTINGIDIFGTESKLIKINGNVVRDWSVARRFEVPAAHPQNFDAVAFETNTGFSTDHEVYRNFVYFDENGTLVPAVRLQLFDGSFTRTVVVESGTYRILLDRDETVECQPGHDIHEAHAHAKAIDVPIIDPPNAEFRYWDDDSPAPGMPHPTGIPDQWQAPMVEPVFINNRASTASPHGWLDLEDPCRTVGNNIIGETEGALSPHFDDGPVFVNCPTNGSPIRFAPYYRLDNQWRSDDFLTLQQAAVNIFVHGNLYHDWVYKLGFREANGNFQQNNFGRGGEGGDPMTVIAYYNDLFVNNAFYSGTEIDGTPGTVYMLRWAWQQQGNDRHGGFSSMIFAHEYQHGVTRRLVGSITLDQPRSLNEGWSDFMAYLYSLEPTENLRDAVVALGGWASWNYNNNASIRDNYYHGIRPFPIAYDMSKAPLTYADTDINQYAIDPDIYFQQRFLIYGPHFVGQVWTSSLWDTFVLLSENYGFEQARTMMARTVIEGQKICPPEPIYTEARDSYVLADEALFGGENRVAIWRSFARRGLGIHAVSPDPRTTEGVIEDFTEPDWGDYNQDGVKDSFDIYGFVDDFVVENRRADLDWDGLWTANDLILFLGMFQE